MASPGEQLRTAREDRGLTLDDVHAATHIRTEYLTALEQDDFAALPGEAVARGFLRNYARYLGLDPKPLLAEYGQTEIALPEPSRDRDIVDVPLQVSPIPIGTVLFTVVFILVVAALVTAVWYVYPRRADVLARLDRAAPIGLFEPTSTVTTTPSATDTPVPIVEENPGEAEQPTRTPLPTATATATPVPTATQPPRTPTRDDAAPADPAPVDEIRVVLEIQAPAWTRVVVDGEEAYAGTLQDGDEREWVGRDTITIRTGNAGGVRMIVNGDDFGVLGEAGEVLDRILRRDGETGQVVVVEPTPTAAPTTAG